MFFQSFLIRMQMFQSDERGAIAIIATALAVPLISATGFGIDYTRITSFRAKVDSAASEATLAGLQSARIALAENPLISTSTLDKIFQDRAKEVFNARAPANLDYVFINNLIFSRVGDTMNGKVDYGAEVTTYFGGLVNMPKIQITGTTTSATPVTPSAPPSDPSIVFEEGFDTNLGTFEMDGGWWGFRQDFNNWLTPNGAIEVGYVQAFNQEGKIEQPPTGKATIAELNGAGNSSITRRLFLERGAYELRYWMTDRFSNSNYDPVWLCGSKQEDVNWAGEGSGVWGYQTNRVGVYLDRAADENPPTNIKPETHGLIDLCATTGMKWIERSVKINIDAAGFFWLTLQAEGSNDGAGGLLSTIKLCRAACKGEPHNNFPWARNTALYMEGFETPIKEGTPTFWFNTTLDNSGTNLGWPKLAPGWTTWPENQVDFQSSTTQRPAKEGQFSVELDASNKSGTNEGEGSGLSNRAISRRFILAPGYYRFEYYYNSSDSPAPQTYCGISTVDSDIAFLSRTYSWTTADTQLLRVYMDSDRMFSHPESEPVTRAMATWKNPFGVSGPLLPKLPSTVIDACVSSKNYVNRKVDVRITKPGFYWLTMRAEGTADQEGPLLDDFVFTALGPLSDPAPQGVITIPAPGIPAGTILRAPGYEFTAN